MAVTIEGLGNKAQETRIDIQVPGPPDFHSVRIRREPRVRRAPEIEIGDPHFDGTFFIEGPMRLVLALLDAETRRLLIRANAEGRLQIFAGTLRVDRMSDEQVPRILPLLLDIGRRLAQPMSVLWCLAENAHRDPEPGVRLRNLLVLARELPGEPWTVEALRTACSDPSPEMRLRAAQELSSEGRGVLRDLAESLEDDAVSAAAISALARELPFYRTREILVLALGGRHLQTARACMERIGASGEAAAIGVLAKVLVSEETDLAVVAAQALGATGSPAAEPPLLDALEREEASLRVAAANALGRVGSAAAVLPLEEAAGGSWLDRELHRAARQAIAEIQSRLQGASPGQLSLPAIEAGQLSLAQAETGRLSLAQETELPLLPHSPDEREQPPRRAREEPVVRPVK